MKGAPPIMVWATINFSHWAKVCIIVQVQAWVILCLWANTYSCVQGSANLLFTNRELCTGNASVTLYFLLYLAAGTHYPADVQSASRHDKILLRNSFFFIPQASSVLWKNYLLLPFLHVLKCRNNTKVLQNIFAYSAIVSCSELSIWYKAMIRNRKL